MKKIFTLLFAIIITASVSGQSFWTEDFGTGCNKGRFANGVATSKGTWSVTSTGTNDAEANMFYISAGAGGTGTGNCAVVNCSNSNQTLHISSHDGFSQDDVAANYNAGGLCPFFMCVTTDTRAESPVIDCSGKSNIKLKFNYVENGSGSSDNATLWYNDGTSWSQLKDMAKAAFCANGRWTLDSIQLPSSANNNANVKIGFRWINNDDADGDDPSFAVDDIDLSVTASTGVPPTAQIAFAGDTAGCTPLCLGFSDNSVGSPTSWLWTFTGGTPSSSTAQNPPGGICWNTGGIYSVKLKVSNAAGSDSVTLSDYITAKTSPPVPTIGQDGDSLYSSTDPSYASYQWYDSTTLVPGATNSYYIATHNGNYNLQVTASNGCNVAVGINVILGLSSYRNSNVITLFPSPAKDELTVSGNWQPVAGRISVYDMLGKKAIDYILDLDAKLTLNVKNLPEGAYFIQIADEKSIWMGRFLKE